MLSQVVTMKTARIVVVSVLGLLYAVLPALAQSADEIIEKHIAASGGRAAFAKITSRTSVGTLSLTTPVGDLMGSIEIYAKKPNKTRTFVKIDATALGGGVIEQDQRFDGTTGYILDSFQGNRPIEGDQLEGLKNGSFPSPFLNYKEAGTTITLGEKEKVGGGDAFVLRLTPKAGPATRVYIDATTFMLIKTAATVNVPQLGGDIEQVVEFSDFRDVDGIKLPFKTKSSNPAQTINVTMTTIKHNADIDDTSFSKPAGQ